MEKICPLRLGSDSWFCSNLSLYFFCGHIETVMITQVLGNLPSDSEIWFWKSNKEKSLGLSEHNFQLLPSSPRGVVWRMKSLEARDAVQIERQCLFMKRQWTHQGELWVATLSSASSEVKKGMQLKLGEGTEYVLFTNRWSLKISLEKVMEEVTAAGLFEESQQSVFHLVSVSAVGSSPPS